MMENRYLFRKRGLYYRPNSQGYTQHIHDAGIYTEAEAEIHAQNPDIQIIPVQTLRDALVDELVNLERRVKECSARIASLAQLADT
jgi:hypothetical protein